MVSFIFIDIKVQRSYMSAHVLLILLHELGKKRLNARFAEHFDSFSQRVTKVKNTGARMLDSIYHMTFR